MAWVEVDDPFGNAISAPKAVDPSAPLPPPYRPEFSAPPAGMPTDIPAFLLGRDVADAGAPPPVESGPRWHEVENPYAEKPASLGFGGVVAEAGRAGLAQGLQSVKDAPTAFSEPTGDRAAVNPQVQELLETPVSRGWHNPEWLAAQITHGLASSAPSLATGFAGGAIGSAYGPGGQLAGSALGFGLGSALQTVAPAYQKARAEGLDHDTAVTRAMEETGIAGAFGAAMGAAPGLALFGKSGEALKRPLGEALAQVFGVQPALSVAQQAAIKVNEGKGLPTAEEAAQTALIGAATGAVLVGGHRLSAAAIEQLRAAGVEPTPINFEGRPVEPGAAPKVEPTQPRLPGGGAEGQPRLRAPTRAEDLPVMPDEEALPPVPQDQGPADRLPGAPGEARRPTLNDTPTPESAAPAPTPEEAGKIAQIREAAARAFPRGGISEINAYRENAGTAESSFGKPNKMYSWGSEKGLGGDRVALVRAQHAEAQGESPRDIWDKYGWYKSPGDGVWIRYINDAGMTVKSEAAKQYQDNWKNTPADGDLYRGRLGDFMEHPELFEDTPGAADVELVLRKKPYGSDRSGFFNHADNQIVIYPPSDDPKSAFNTAVHEIDHFMQSENARINGASLESPAALNWLALYDIKQRLRHIDQTGEGAEMKNRLLAQKGEIEQAMHAFTRPAQPEGAKTSLDTYRAYRAAGGENMAEAAKTAYRAELARPGSGGAFPETFMETSPRNAVSGVPLGKSPSSGAPLRIVRGTTGRARQEAVEAAFAEVSEKTPFLVSAERHDPLWKEHGILQRVIRDGGHAVARELDGQAQDAERMLKRAEKTVASLERDARRLDAGASLVEPRDMADKKRSITANLRRAQKDLAEWAHDIHNMRVAHKIVLRAMDLGGDAVAFSAKPIYEEIPGIPRAGVTPDIPRANAIIKDVSTRLAQQAEALLGVKMTKKEAALFVRDYVGNPLIENHSPAENAVEMAFPDEVRELRDIMEAREYARLSVYRKSSSAAASEDNLFSVPGLMFSLAPEPEDVQTLRTPHADWGNPRENAADKARALERLREIAALPMKDAPWEDVVSARKDIAQIVDNLFKYGNDYNLDRLRNAPDGDIRAYLSEPKDVAQIPGQHRRSIYNDTDIAPEIRDVVNAAKAAIDHAINSGRRGVLALYGKGASKEPEQPVKGNPARVGEKMSSGFYSMAGRKLAEVPEALFAQGAQPVIDWLSQAGVKRAEILHFGFDQLPPRKPTTRAQFQKAVADRAIDFKGKLSTLNPERSKTDYELGGTRAFTGPRIPGRGTYFEKLIAFPKKLPGGESFAPGYFVAPHWEDVHHGTWASWRGSVRDIPGWGKMVIGEEGQSDYMQGANVGRRPRMSQAEYMRLKKDRAKYERVVSEVNTDLKHLVRYTGKEYDDRVAIIYKFTGEQWANVHAPESWGHELQRLGDRILESRPSEDWPFLRKTLARIRSLHDKNPQFFEPGAHEKYVRTEKAFTPETPLDESYVRTMARDLLLHAAKQGADSVAIATSKTTARIQVNEGAAHFYDQQMRPAMQKELRRITGDGSLTLERVELPKAIGGPKREKPYDVWAAPMTKATRDKILTEGLPLFSLRGFYSPAGRAIETFPQETATVGQWSALLAPGKIPGVTKDWRDYVDIDGALKQLADDKGKISRAALKAYVDAADVDLDLVVLRGPVAPKDGAEKTPMEQQREERQKELDDTFSMEPTTDTSLTSLVTEQSIIYEHIAETPSMFKILQKEGVIDDNRNYIQYPSLQEMGDLGIHVAYTDSRALEERGGDTSGILVVYTTPGARAFTIMDDGYGGTDMRRYGSKEAAENNARSRHDSAVERLLEEEFEDVEDDENGPETKFHEYVIPGARYMAELLVKPKNLEGKYESKHFETHEIIHQRLGEVDLPPLPGQTAPRKGLLIEETQSDAHAMGEDIGYEREAERVAAIKDWQDKRDAVEAVLKPLREELSQAADGYSYNLNAMQERLQEAVDGMEDKVMRSRLRGLFGSWLNPLMRVMGRHGDMDAPKDAPLLPTPEALMEERGRRLRADIDPREWEQGVMMATAFLELVPEREAKLVRKFAVREREAKNALALAGEENKYPMPPKNKMLDIPYKGGLWLDLGLKLALRYAVENGYDTIVLPKARMIGDAVGASRIAGFDWSAIGNDIVLALKDNHGHPLTDEKTEKPQTIELKTDPDGGHKAALAFIAKKFGAPAAESVRYDLAMGRMNPLQDIIVESHASAWELAEPGDFHGRVDKKSMPEGGAANLGMQLQYEEKTPAFFAKYTAKWGGKVTEEPVHDVAGKLTEDAFKRAYDRAYENGASEQTLAELDGAMGRSRWGDVDKAYNLLSSEAKVYVDAQKSAAPTLKTIDITPQMREAILGGQPLYNKKGGEPKLDGYWSRRQRTIGIALSAADPMRVFHEESAHAMGPNGLDLLSPQQNALLRQTAVKEGWIEKYIGEKDAARYRAAYRHAPDVEGLILQEAIDHAYADYAASRDKAAIPQQAATAFDRVREFFDRTKKALVGRGAETVGDVFGGMYGGDVGGRYREPELIRFHDLLPVAGGMAGAASGQIDFTDLIPEQAPVIAPGVRLTFADLIPRGATR